MARRGMLGAVAAVGVGMIAATASAGPLRVVSLNPCLDAILLSVADRGQIAALSHYSREPSQSPFSAQARRFPFTWGTAEEVVTLRPNLVLTSGSGAIALSDVMPRLGVRQAKFAVPASIDESLAQIARVAALVGHADRGAALNARIRAALAAAAPPPTGPRLSALIYEYHGLVSGPHTLVDELMRRAGFDNRAWRYGLQRTGEVGLDALVADPPQVLLAGRLAPGEPVWADRTLSHPVLHALPANVRLETFPESLMFCGGPAIVLAVEALARARQDALAGVSR